MNTQTGEIVSNSFMVALPKEEQARYVTVVRDLSRAERFNKQIMLYAPCACGSGKKFKFCCHRP